jgi:hypothetical protein
VRVERYQLEERLEAKGAVEVWRARDSADHGAEVTLQVVTIAGNEEDVAALRAEARRQATQSSGTQVRIFEDLAEGRFGVAYKLRTAPIPTLVANEAKRGSRAPLLAAGGLAVFGLAAGGWWVGSTVLSEEADEPRKQRSRASVPDEETEEEAPAPLRATAKASACDADALAVKGGCLDREAVRQRAFDGCVACRTVAPSTAAPDPLPEASVADAAACSRDARAPSAAASCVAFDQARAFCRSLGKDLPPLEAWLEGRAAGLVWGLSFEWTSSQWKPDGIMRRTGAKVGAPSQMHLALAAPNLGFRCYRER